MADEGDFRCFRSAGASSSLRLQFVFQTDKPDTGTVVYQNGSGPIPVKLLAEKELNRGPQGRPSEIEARWQEITPDGRGGTYVVVSQGAVISAFRYIRKTDGKSFVFNEDTGAVADKGCTWNTR